MKSAIKIVKRYIAKAEKKYLKAQAKYNKYDFPNFSSATEVDAYEMYVLPTLNALLTDLEKAEKQ